MESNFYIDLPSNVINDMFDQNTLANYKTKLANRQVLSGNWEVGLSEISYKMSWYTLSKPQSIKLLYLDNKFVINKASNKVYIRIGSYESIDDLINEINNKINDIKVYYDLKANQMPKINIEKRTRLINIKYGIDGTLPVLLKLDSELAEMMGFNYSKLITDQLDLLRKIQLNNSYKILDTDLLYSSHRPFDLSAGIHSLFVYCDIVRPSLVGNSYTQLLRLVEIPNNIKFGDQVVIPYPNTYYIPLLTYDFETIEIDIKSDTGDTIPFQFGRTNVKLHFRQKVI